MSEKTISAEVKEQLDLLTKLIHDEREANEKRLAELEQLKSVKPETEAEIKRIEAAIETARDAIEKQLKAELKLISDAVDEHGRAIGRLTVGGGGDSGERREELRTNARLFLAAKTGKPLEQVKDADVEAYQRYRRAFNSFLRRGGTDGELLTPEIRADLAVGSDADGGFWVPTEMSNRVMTRVFESSDIRGLATVETTTADALELPIDVDEAESGGWVSEKQTRSDTGTPKIGIQKIEIHEQFAQPKATQRLLDDATRDVEAWLAGKIADKLARVENQAFVIGDGVGRPRGFLNYGASASTQSDAARDWGKLQYVLSGSISGFPLVTAGDATYNDADPLLVLISTLKPVYRSNARFLMNRTTEAVIRKLKDADGRYLVGLGDIRDAAVGFLLFGYPIATAEDMPAIGSDSFAIAFGDFRAGYTIVDRQGIRVLRDPYTQKPFVKFYTTKRVGGDVTDFDAIKLMKFATS